MVNFLVLITVLWVSKMLKLGEGGQSVYGNSALFLQLFQKSKIISKYKVKNEFEIFFPRVHMVGFMF